MKTRELKFRAWSTKFNKFLSVDLLNDHILEELDTLKITQFTGLQDKNGKDVYEGDIIKYEFPSDAEVDSRKSREVENKVVVRRSTEGEDFHPGFRVTNLWCQGGNFEVIGNIFENGEGK